jgi:hypothetical protein
LIEVAEGRLDNTKEALLAFLNAHKNEWIDKND